MPPSRGGYPTRDHVVDYLTTYEQRYSLPIQRPVRVGAVTRATDGLAVRTDRGTWMASAVVSATGGASQPYIPAYSGRALFRGMQIHSSAYRSPDDFVDQRVLVVGGGNSGAQILADISKSPSGIILFSDIAFEAYVGRRPIAGRQARDG
ncbi:NAD(P)-binding domain-containing protein, partial [Belnapia moabensis]|uniref:NAD(P)-binding domain-containing protein n=1 Tax=Belnapia moabensis TaxID=365533 RepID=UPI001FE04EC4